MRSGTKMNCDEKWSCAQPRRSSTRRLCVRHLPHERQPRPSSAHARRSSTRRLCVLRLPNERQPRPSGAHAQRPRAPQLDQEALCTAPSARKAASVHRPCHTKGSRGPAAANARRSSTRRLSVLPLPQFN